MIVKPKVRGFICTTAHPSGCKKNIENQIAYTKSKGEFNGPKKVLVIGSSTGYGLASRISLAFGAKADTLGIMFEKNATEKRTATPGFYNTKAFEEAAAKDGLYAKTINGDAFSKEIKDKTIEMIKSDLGKVDCVIYSLAAPRRTMADGTIYSSVLKTVGEAFTEKNLDLRTNQITTATIEPATDEEVEATVKVMGGEDWIDWIDALSLAGVLEDNAITVAYSYIGPKLTYPVYCHGTIGKAKEHLYTSSLKINDTYKGKLKAYVSVNKALVTQASCAIPIVPLYITILYKVMKEMGIHEDCIMQMNRLFREKLPSADTNTDSEGRIRLDDFELREDVQNKVSEIWKTIDSDNLIQYVDLDGYWDSFYQMFGFRFEDIDYDADVQI